MPMINEINIFLFTRFNQLAGHSWAFDTLVGLLEENNLIKGGILGACFVAAWFRYEKKNRAIQVRRVLLVSLLASVCSLAITKSVSHLLFYPRPYFYSHRLYHLEGASLREFDTIDFNLPLDRASRELYADYLRGDFTLNHLGTFPSDNASFAIAIALGILFAYRSIGILALLWALLFVLPAKIISGMHFPADIAAGALSAMAVFFLFKFLADRPLKPLFNRVVRWTFGHATLSSALLFIVVYEIVSTLDHLNPILQYAGTLARHLLGAP